MWPGFACTGEASGPGQGSAAGEGGGGSGRASPARRVVTMLVPGGSVVLLAAGAAAPAGQPPAAGQLPSAGQLPADLPAAAAAEDGEEEARLQPMEVTAEAAQETGITQHPDMAPPVAGAEPRRGRRPGAAEEGGDPVDGAGGEPEWELL